MSIFLVFGAGITIIVVFSNPGTWNVQKKSQSLELSTLLNETEPVGIIEHKNGGNSSGSGRSGGGNSDARKIGEPLTLVLGAGLMAVVAEAALALY